MYNSGGLIDTTRERKDPSAYQLKEISIKNAVGKVYNITQLVVETSITESVYTLALTAELSVRDTVNLFEELRISGQELVKITFIVQDPKGPKKTVTKDFLLSQITAFGKVNDAVQAYTLKLISPHAFINQVSRISRAGDGSVVDQIKKILKNDLQYNGDIIVDAESKGNLKLIYPNMRPFMTIEWLQRRAFDDTGSPIYVYETFDGMHIRSYASMAIENVLANYTIAFKQGKNPNTKEGFEEGKFKVINISSDMNSSKILQARAGAFASTTKVLDYSTKKYYDVKYDYISHQGKFIKADPTKKDPLISSAFLIKGETLNKHSDAYVMYMNQNSLAWDKMQNYHEPALQTMGSFVSMLEAIDNNKQSITINGNPECVAGSKIFIKAPKAIDPEVWKRAKGNSESDKGALADMMISGAYIITSIKHKLAEKYTQEMMLKRDYTNYNFG